MVVEGSETYLKYTRTLPDMSKVGRTSPLYLVPR